MLQNIYISNNPVFFFTLYLSELCKKHTKKKTLSNTTVFSIDINNKKRCKDAENCTAITGINYALKYIQIENFLKKN